MDLDRYIVKWNAYTVLDWFSNIGGLYIAAVMVFAFINSLIKINSLENFMVSQLYKGASDQGRESLASAKSKFAVGQPLEIYREGICSKWVGNRKT